MTVADLLAEPKAFGSGMQKKAKSNKVQLEWDVKLLAACPGEFIAYVRVPSNLPEEWSVGLRYAMSGERPAVLLRMNGNHGAHMNPDRSRFSHGPHIHRPMEIELARPLATGQWPEGPKYAEVLAPKFQHIVNGWHELCERANITSAPWIDSVLVSIATSVGIRLGQMDIEDVLG